MKIFKFFIILLSFIFLFGCSVQKNMNAEIFFKRLSSECDDFDFKNKNIFCKESGIVCFINDKSFNEYCFELGQTVDGDINKISFACNKTDKANNFINHISHIISVYSPEENSEEILDKLTENGNPKKEHVYYETKWYCWSFYSDENGMFFSVINKKLSEPLTAERSLKQNDKSDFQ